VRLPEDVQRRIKARVEGYREEMIEFQRRLTAISGLGPDNGGEGEEPRAQFLENYLREAGLPAPRRVDAPDPRVPAGRRPNLVLRVPGGDAPALWVLCHLDTVPPGDLGAWSGDPLEMRVEGDRLIGRGVEDNQQGLTASLFGLRALHEEGLRPPGDVGLLLVADEESGNRYGIDFLLSTEPELVKPSDLVVVPDFGLPAGDVIETAEKGILLMRADVHGRQVHGSMPHLGANAHRAAAHLVVRVDQALHEAFPASDPRFDPPASTFEPTKRLANVPNINTIPGEERLWFDCRVLPRYPLEDVLRVAREAAAGLEAEFGVCVALESEASFPAPPATSDDAPVVRLLGDALRELRGVEARTIGIGGGTVGLSGARCARRRVVHHGRQRPPTGGVRPDLQPGGGRPGLRLPICRAPTVGVGGG